MGQESEKHAGKSFSCALAKNYGSLQLLKEAFYLRITLFDGGNATLEKCSIMFGQKLQYTARV